MTGHKRTIAVEYSSGVAAAEADMGVKADTRRPFTPVSMPWRTENDNFITNRISLQSHSDGFGHSNPVGLSATWACVNLIAGTIGSLPLMVYRNENGVRKIARDHELYYVLHDSPNFDQTALDFWEYQSAGIELQGNAYARIERRTSGSVFSLTPVRPDLMTVHRGDNGMLEYSWTEDGERFVEPVENVLHIRGGLGDALGGASTLTACRSVFSGATAADNAARTTFANGMRPSGVLSTDAAVSLTSEQKTELNGYLDEKFTGAMNSGRPLLLDRGMKWQQLNITPEDAQMLDSRKFSGEEICRLFGIPPAMVGYGDKSSNWGTGKEVDVLGFQKFTLRKRLKRIEQAVMKQLLTASDRAQGLTVEFNIEGLLRGDSAGRADFYQKMTQLGAMTINEVRALENMAPVSGGDVPRMQMQNVPITSAGQEKP